LNGDNTLPKTYDPSLSEPKWQSFWLRPEVYDRVYRIKGDGRPPFFVDTPPPFTNGELHLGQGYWVTIADVLSRYKRMRGYDVLIPQGWDTHGLPTELKVERRLGVSRSDMHLFEQKCIEWTNDMIKKMKNDMMILGYRPDWEALEYSTHSSEYIRAVQLSLIEMHKKGFLYVGRFPVLWCPRDETAIAQAETGYIEEEGFVYFIRFSIVSGESITIATTRPELIPACQAVVVHPADGRFSNLVGKQAIVPFSSKTVRIISDPDVDMEFGSGAVMVCSYGDETDIKWIRRHSLPSEQILDEKGRFTAPEFLKGLDVKQARAVMVERLRAAHLIESERRVKHKVLVHAERSDCRAPIEFLEKEQLMIKLHDLLPLVTEASERMTFHPDFMRNKLKEWVRTIEWDWIVSRQRVFGTPIPFYICVQCKKLLPVDESRLPFDPRKEKPVYVKCPSCSSESVVPVTDVCDGWIDSSITPLYVSGYFRGGDSYKKFYPADLRLQGQEIVRTWLFYTMVRSIALTGSHPFKGALIHGWVLTVEGSKMSKSLGGSVLVSNVVSQYGADSLRYSYMTFPLGFDFTFSPEFVRKGKLFVQKIWSAYRFSSRYLGSGQIRGAILSPVDHWILKRLKETLDAVTRDFDAYEFQDGLSKFYDFFWHDLCDEYLESVKPRLTRENPNPAAADTLERVMWASLRIIAPIMPHLAEEIYQLIFSTFRKELSVHAANWPSQEFFEFDDKGAKIGEMVVQVIKEARRVKVASKIPLGQRFPKLVVFLPEGFEPVKEHSDVVRAVIKADAVQFEDGAGSLSVRLEV
jgi:valyl-tRNA synthetase